MARMNFDQVRLLSTRDLEEAGDPNSDFAVAIAEVVADIEGSSVDTLNRVTALEDLTETYGDIVTHDADEFDQVGAASAALTAAEAYADGLIENYGDIVTHDAAEFEVAGAAAALDYEDVGADAEGSIGGVVVTGTPGAGKVIKATGLTTAEWDDEAAAGTGLGDLISTNNLSDLDDASEARDNLELGTAASFAADDFLPVFNVRSPTYGAVGDGTTDDTAAFLAAIAALGNAPGQVIIPVSAAAYRISAPLILRAGQSLIGLGISNTVAGVSLKATAGFTGDAMIKSYSWDHDDWWHWGSIENLRLDCNSVAAIGVAVHQMGENSTIRRVLVTNATDTGFKLTGAHAPATLENVNASSCPYGVKLTSHATFTGNSGVVRIQGISGDNHSSAFIYSNGSHTVSALGVKHEGTAPYTYQFAGTGSICTLLASGYANITGTSLVRIDGTARPIITLVSHRWQGVTNVIDDTVGAKTITAASMTYFPALLTWNGTQLLGGQEIVMGQDVSLKWRRSDNASLVTVLDQPSDLTVRLKAVSGPGIRFDDSSGTKIATFTANGHTLDKFTLMVGAKFVRALVASTLAAGGAVTCDADAGNEFDVTLQANATSITINNGTAGEVVTVTVIQDVVGGRTYTWASTCKFVGGSGPSDTTASARTSVTFRKSGSNWYEISRAVAVA